MPPPTSESSKIPVSNVRPRRRCAIPQPSQHHSTYSSEPQRQPSTSPYTGIPPILRLTSNLYYYNMPYSHPTPRHPHPPSPAQPFPQPSTLLPPFPLALRNPTNCRAITPSKNAIIANTTTSSRSRNKAVSNRAFVASSSRCSNQTIAGWGWDTCAIAR